MNYEERAKISTYPINFRFFFVINTTVLENQSCICYYLVGRIVQSLFQLIHYGTQVHRPLDNLKYVGKIPLKRFNLLLIPQIEDGLAQMANISDRELFREKMMNFIKHIVATPNKRLDKR